MVIEVVSSLRLRADRISGPTKTVPLSIIDSTTTYYSPSGLVAFYDGKTADPLASNVSHFADSLKITLNAWPFLAGQLSWTGYEPQRGHSYRYQRLQVTWDSENDPGVDFVIARASKGLAELVPSKMARHQGGSWDSSSVPTTNFFSSGPLALQDMKTFSGLPAASGQLTLFTDGGIAVAFRIAHPLADARTLRLFMGDWSETFRALQTKSPVSAFERLLEPFRLDHAAAGLIDGAEPDDDLVEISRSLPVHRYDQWASRKSAPYHHAVQDQPIPIPGPEFDRACPSIIIPWAEWNVAKPCAHRIIHFSASQIRAIHEAASSCRQSVSRHDALVAHMWSRVARARQLDNDDQDVFVDMSLGLRKRLSPPLPEDFIGSPVIMAHARLTGQQVCGGLQTSAVAKTIGDARKKINVDTVPALLHGLAFEACPTRLWQGFLGRRHIMLTSWVHEKLYNLSFDGTSFPLLVRPLLMPCDGLMCFTEPDAVRDGDPWHQRGIDMELYLEDEAMSRLLLDPLLWH